MTPLSADAPVRMPGEFELHAATIMCWPARDEIWGTHRAQADEDYATIASAIAGFEPVLMLARPELAERAASMCGPGVDVMEMPLDDSWARDTGPIHVIDPDGRRSAVDFEFNAWGNKYEPFDDDAALARRFATLQGERVETSAMVLEGGSIAVDGAGTLITTEQCLLAPEPEPVAHPTPDRGRAG